MAKVPAPADADIQKVYEDNKEELQGQPLEPGETADHRVPESGEGAGPPARVHPGAQDQVQSRRPAESADRRGRDRGTTARGGGAKAPVTIVEFSDYQCPFCKRGEDSVQKVFDTYGDKVRIVFRDYPLPFHERARPAAEAAELRQRPGQILGVQQEALRQSGGARGRQPEGVRQGPRARHREVRRVLRQETSSARKSTRIWRPA